MALAYSGLARREPENKHLDFSLFPLLYLLTVSPIGQAQPKNRGHKRLVMEPEEPFSGDS